MKNSRKNQTVNLALAAVFAALITALTMVHIPVPIAAGYIHFGDSIIYLATSFLPPPFALAAAAIGGALADIAAGVAYWAPFTFVIKALNAVPFIICFKHMKNNKNKIVSAQTIGMTVISAIITIVMYYLASLVVYTFLEISAQGLSVNAENFNAVLKSYASVAALSDTYGSLIQGIGSAIIYVVIGLALDAVKIKQKIKRW